MAEEEDEQDAEAAVPDIAGVFVRPQSPPPQQEQQQQELAAEEAEREEKREAVAAEAAEPVISAVPRAAAADDAQRFIDSVIGRMRVTASFRWTQYRLQMLEAAGREFDPPMLDMTSVLKEKVMNCVRGREAEERQAANAGDDVQ